MPWIDRNIQIGTTKIIERDFKCGWCGVMMTVNPKVHPVPFGWIHVEEAEDSHEYYCSRQCRYDHAWTKND